jgi:CBS-domain-containing membrane protein
LASNCSHSLVTVTATDSVEEAVRLMHTHAVRRLPVVDGGQAVGIVSLGDLAVERDPGSALGRISCSGSQWKSGQLAIESARPGPQSLILSKASGPHYLHPGPHY